MGDYTIMKIFRSDRAVFVFRAVAVCMIFALTLAACIFASLAVSGELDNGRYLPENDAANIFKIALVASVVITVALLLVDKRTDPTDRTKDTVCAEKDIKADVSTDSGLEAEDSTDLDYAAEDFANSGLAAEDSTDLDHAAEVSAEDGSDNCSDVADNVGNRRSSIVTKVIGVLLTCTSSMLTAYTLYVFFFALTDESLGVWGNLIMVSAFVSALFFLFKTLPNARVGRVICGFGVFVFAAIVIASLYLDHVIEINSDFKLLVQFGAAGMLISTIADIRNTLSRISDRCLLGFKAIAFILCSICPAVLLSLSGEFVEALPGYYYIYSWLYLVCAVASAIEMFSTLFNDKSRCI